MIQLGSQWFQVTVAQNHNCVYENDCFMSFENGHIERLDCFIVLRSVTFNCGWSHSKWGLLKSQSLNGIVSSRVNNNAKRKIYPAYVIIVATLMMYIEA